MAVILGIDAAWTESGTSGVALLKTNCGRKLLSVASSYHAFLETNRRTSPSEIPDINALLYKAHETADVPVDVVAIDMPLARKPIRGRRVADDLVAREFGRFGAAVHSPSTARPGSHGRHIWRALNKAGYPLATTAPYSGRATIEVFPLAALVRLMNLAYRPPYKISRISRYWRNELPALSREQKFRRLLDTWSKIIKALSKQINDFQFDLPEIRNLRLPMLKPYEDKLDAIISAWVGACFVEGLAEPFGDNNSSIWIPRREE